MYRLILSSCVLLAAMTAPAASFDCAKATTGTEKLICSDTALKAIDDKLQEHWQSTRGELSSLAWSSLLRDQRTWLKQREMLCSPGNNANPIECLTSMTQQRIGEIAMAPRSGPGASGQMQPFEIEKAAKLRQYKVELHGLRFSNAQQPGEKAFNAAVDRLVGEAPVNETVDFDPPGGTLDYFQSMTVTYAAPHLLSVTASTGRYDGGAHPNRYTVVINVSTEEGALNFDRLFPANAVAKLSQACFDGLKGNSGDVLTQQQRRDAMFEATPQSMQSTVGDLANWAFNEEGATVLFQPYAIGPYAVGEFECQLPLAVLRDLSQAAHLLPR